MRYIQVEAYTLYSNVIHGAVYYGLEDKMEAIDRFLKEFPQYRMGNWIIRAKAYK